MPRHHPSVSKATTSCEGEQREGKVDQRGGRREVSRGKDGHKLELGSAAPAYQP